MESSKELTTLVLSGNCVVFVGAGLSIPPAKKWESLVKDIADNCKVKFDNNDLHTVIDNCINKDEHLCNQFLNEEFPFFISSTRNAMSDLLKLKFKAILTTNFDPWISRDSWRKKHKNVFIYPDLPLLKPINDNIYYLHGRFDSEAQNSSIRGLVFGKNSFTDAYNNSLLTGLLLNLLVYERILFIAFNPTEKYFSRLVESSVMIQKRIMDEQGVSTSSPKHFCLLPQSDKKFMDEKTYGKNERMIMQTKALSITPITYQMEGEDHRGLERLLHNWRQLGDPKLRPPELSTGFE